MGIVFGELFYDEERAAQRISPEEQALALIIRLLAFECFSGNNEDVSCEAVEADRMSYDAITDLFTVDSSEGSEAKTFKICAQGIRRLKLAGSIRGVNRYASRLWQSCVDRQRGRSDSGKQNG
jgi:hypothetical protein